MKSLFITGQTDVGQRRTDNQDTFICTPIWSDACALLAAVDGVGGYAGGDRAAATARESIERYMATPTGDPLSMLREAVVFANNQINEQRRQDPRLGQMCCVLTTALADASAQKLYFVHVGDTRLYRYRRGQLDKLTRDHSLVGVREDASQLSEAEAMQHPRRNEILREVGSQVHRVDDPDFLDWGETDFRPGDWLLLCSDGLTDMITQAQIVSVLEQVLPIEKQATELIRLANQQGGNDNITVVLAKHGEPLVPPEPDASPVTAENQRPDKRQPVGSDERVTKPLPPARPGRSVLWVLVGLLGVGLAGGLLWYPRGPVATPAAPPDPLPTPRPPADSVAGRPPAPTRLDSLLQTAYRRPDHRLVLTDDTVRLRQPLQLTDSLQTIVGRAQLTVVIPADPAHPSAALQLTRRGSIALENIVFSGFDTGIETTQETTLHLTKVFFSNVKQPIRATVRQDTCLNTTIVVSVQNQPVLLKSPRH